MESAYLSLAVIGGFAFASCFQISRFRIVQSSGYALFFYAAFWGYVWFQAAALIVLISNAESIFGNFLEFWQSPIENDFISVAAQTLRYALPTEPPELATISLLSLWLGLTAWLPLNWVVHRIKSPTAIAYDLVQEWGTELEQVLHRAHREFRYLLFSLKSGKVYVAAVFQTPSLNNYNSDPGTGVFVIPMLSGYRDQATREVVFTTDYRWIESEPTVQAHELSTLIPLRQIVSVTHFDLAHYQRFAKMGAYEEYSAPDPDPERNHPDAP